MSGTTSRGWPYVTPDDHPKEYPAASQALANKLNSDVTVRGSITRSTDTAGSFTISAAEVGLTTITGVVIAIQYSADASQIWMGTGRVNSATSIGVRVWKLTATGSGTVNFVASTSITVHYLAWGT